MVLGCRYLLRTSSRRNEWVVHDHGHDWGEFNLLTDIHLLMAQSFLTPMGAGTQATRAGWRASYRALGIVNAVLFGLFVFLYEETKYTPVVMGVGSGPESQNIPAKSIKSSQQPDIKCTDRQESHHELDTTIPLNTWRQRLALVTYTAEPIWPYFYRPFVVLTTFPAVLFCALQYALGVAWLTILSSVLGLVFPMPPYNFTPEQIGFMSVGPFVGNLLGSAYGGFLGDRSILFFARRNKGYYEPEMRLYILHLPALTLAGGLIMFGVTISRVRHLPCIVYLLNLLTMAAVGPPLDLAQYRRRPIRLRPRQYRRCSADACHRQLPRRKTPSSVHRQLPNRSNWYAAR